MSDASRLEERTDMVTKEHHWHLVITFRDAIRWDAERLDMVEDAMFLVRQALAGNVKGPLTLPRTQLPIRTP